MEKKNTRPTPKQLAEFAVKQAKIIRFPSQHAMQEGPFTIVSKAYLEAEATLKLLEDVRKAAYELHVNFGAHVTGPDDPDFPAKYNRLELILHKALLAAEPKRILAP